MISKNFLNKTKHEDFLQKANALGIAVGKGARVQSRKAYIDLESFFLEATYNIDSSRLAEGFICWLLKYGHLLSPSKIRRLIQAETNYDHAILGAFLDYLQDYNINKRQFQLLEKFAGKKKKKTSLYKGPRPQKANPHFLKYNIICHHFQLNENKFLRLVSYTMKHCLEIRNRALFGSSVNADIATYLHWHPNATPYEVAKNTANHKASVFKHYYDVKMAM